MKWLKKSSVVLTSLVLTSALVTGCGGNNAANSPGGTVQPGSEGSSELKPYEVVMVFPDAPQNDNQRVQDAMNDYLAKTYPEMNMTVKLNPIDWGAWSDKTNLMMASGDKMDLLFTADWLGFQQQVTKGACCRWMICSLNTARTSKLWRRTITGRLNAAASYTVFIPTRSWAVHKGST